MSAWTTRLLALAGLLCAALLQQGCATKVTASAIENPPPAERFAAFGRIEMQPVRYAQGVSGSAAALLKIQQNLDKDLAGFLPVWNGGPGNGRTLTVAPMVEQMEFTGGASRVLFGPLAGSSGVQLKLYIRDGQGRVIATPEFFQRADAWAAGFVLGVHDNLMLTRVSNLASNYLIVNHDIAKGGPTGADAKALGQDRKPQ